MINNKLAKNKENDFIYTGCQILNKNLFKKFEVSNFPISDIWNSLLKENKLYGYENNTTNNRMEITAAINAIKSLKIKSNVVIHTDSKYLMNGINDWINNWKNNNWKTSTKKDVKNVDLWKAIDDLSSEHTIKWNWVKGHSGNPGNEMADDLANLAILKKSEKLE